jgi:hypothetical protein
VTAANEELLDELRPAGFAIAYRMLGSVLAKLPAVIEPPLPQCANGGSANFRWQSPSPNALHRPSASGSSESRWRASTARIS